MDPDGIYTATAVVDTTGVVTGWSEGARLLLGWPAGETVGRPATDLLAGPPPPGLPEPSGPGPELRGTLSLRRRDRSVLHVEITAHPWLDRNGQPRGYLLTAPSEALRRLRRNREYLDRAMRRAPVPIALTDTEPRFWWVNDRAAQVVLAPGLDPEGLPLADVLTEPTQQYYVQQVRKVGRTGEPERYVDYAEAPLERSGPHPWAVMIWDVRDDADRVRAVATWTVDMSTEYWARRRLALLSRASSAIGTTLGVAATARELVDSSVPDIADRVAVDLFPEVLRGEEPPVRPAGGRVTLHRTASRQAGDAGGPSAPQGAPEGEPESEPEGEPGGRPRGELIDFPADSTVARCLAAGEPAVHLIERPAEEPRESASAPGLETPPAADWPPGTPVIDAGLGREGVTARIIVPLRAREATLGVAVFERHHRREVFTADDLILVGALATKAAIALDNARRYARERTTALTLQRSLLPGSAPDRAAVDVATLYLPGGGRAGVGGDWHDVIPLSGTRVALVVGDVVGHGLHAAASMGRLRTAVRTLADVDLPPDELITHLDDLVIHLADDVGAEPAETGATCLYAVYDPVSRRCTVASAGHPLPILITPDGTAPRVPGVPGPPLGVGGVPFEAAEFDVPENSLLTLFTDGLIEARDRDIDRGLADLRGVLSRPGRSLQELCDGVVETLRPGQGPDDAALLLARTHALPPEHVASWTIPAESVKVNTARTLASEQLAAWGLGELAFTTELVVSELVTNAIRYGQPPIHLRMIRNVRLIVEVSDTSSTEPHLRRARLLDEGGRGLLLVGQVSAGWGTRHTHTGKTIWCEQPLPVTPGAA